MGWGTHKGQGEAWGALPPNKGVMGPCRVGGGAVHKGRGVPRVVGGSGVTEVFVPAPSKVPPMGTPWLWGAVPLLLLLLACLTALGRGHQGTLGDMGGGGGQGGTRLQSCAPSPTWEGPEVLCPQVWVSESPLLSPRVPSQH